MISLTTERTIIRDHIKEVDFKEYVWHDGALKDRVEYRLLKPEWKSQHFI